jgi:hypothetical protein
MTWPTLSYFVSYTVVYVYSGECCLLGYKEQVRTSQETHYVSATESSQLMLSKI